jgi:hypothetical protein
MLPTLYASRPPSFRHFLHDSLLASGLPYGPQAREQLARAYPDLFGNAYSSTLRGYERWLARQGARDSLEAFAGYMDGRYRRWATDSARTGG